MRVHAPLQPNKRARRSCERTAKCSGRVSIRKITCCRSTRLSSSSLRERTRKHAKDALLVRHWLEATVLRKNKSEPPELDRRAWEIALLQERCSALLLQQIGSLEALSLERRCSDVIRRSAESESLRILSARAHLLTLAETARKTGVLLAVLKGGVSIGYGHHVFVNDVDVLAALGKEEVVALELDKRGFVPESKGGVYHLEPRVSKYAIPVEVHRAVLGIPRPDQSLWDSVEPIPSLQPLVRLSWANHVWTVLCQMVLKHPDRLYRIRDLFLLKTALSSCNPEERKALEIRAAAHPLHDEFRRVVAYALGEESQLDRAHIRRALVRGYLVLARSRSFSAYGKGLLSHHMLETAMNGHSAEWRRMVGALVYSPNPFKVVRRAFRQIGISGLTKAVTWDCSRVD